MLCIVEFFINNTTKALKKFCKFQSKSLLVPFLVISTMLKYCKLTTMTTIIINSFRISVSACDETGYNATT